MPGLPQLGLYAVVLLLLVAYGWAMKRWGRVAERADWLKATGLAEREVQDAVEKARRNPVKIDMAWFRKQPPKS